MITVVVKLNINNYGAIGGFTNIFTAEYNCMVFPVLNASNVHFLRKPVSSGDLIIYGYPVNSLQARFGNCTFLNQGESIFAGNITSGDQLKLYILKVD